MIKGFSINSRRQFLTTSIGGVVALSSSQESFAKSEKSAPRVLLLGDSISIGYTDFVVGILLGEIVVARPLNQVGFYVNCAGTTNAVENLESWLGKENWDVIHFNFGLHDLKHVDPVTGKNSRDPAHPQQASLQQYEKNLEWIVEKLSYTQAKLIFATTTPFLENPGGPLRDVDQPQKYNEVALEIMRRYEVSINDLYSFVLPRVEELLPPHNVHFRPAGSLELAQQVVAHTRNVLGKR